MRSALRRARAMSSLSPAHPSVNSPPGGTSPPPRPKMYPGSALTMCCRISCTEPYVPATVNASCSGDSFEQNSSSSRFAQPLCRTAARSVASVMSAVSQWARLGDGAQPKACPIRAAPREGPSDDGPPNERCCQIPQQRGREHRRSLLGPRCAHAPAECVQGEVDDKKREPRGQSTCHCQPCSRGDSLRADSQRERGDAGEDRRRGDEEHREDVVDREVWAL